MKNKAAVQFPLFPMDVLNELREHLTDEEYEAELDAEWEEYLASIINGPFYVTFEMIEIGQITLIVTKHAPGMADRCTIKWRCEVQP